MDLKWTLKGVIDDNWKRFITSANSTLLKADSGLG